MDPANFDKMSRDELVAKARSLGVERPELMTRVELGDEIVRRTQTDPSAQQRARGWLGVARDLVANVVGSGLSMPDAAALIRGDRSALELKGPSPVATVTLAEIYATQGHTERALAMLDEVLAREPEHAAALSLRERLLNEPRARRPDSGGGQAKSSEPQVWSAAENLDEEEQAPRTSQTPVDDPARLEFPEPELPVEESPQASASSEAARAVQDADGSTFEPVSLAPPLTDLPTRPDAAALDGAPSPPVGFARPVPPAEEVARGVAPEVQAPEPAPFEATASFSSDAEVSSDAVPTPATPELRAEVAEPPPALSPSPDSLVEAAPEPLAEAAPALDSAPEPLHEGTPEPLADAAFESAPEPLHEGTPEPLAQAAELSAEAAVEPASQPQSDIVPTLLPAAEPEPEPAPVLIVLRRAGGDPLVCWDLSESELNRGPLELECHAFSAGPKGAERRSLTVGVTSRRGSAELSGLARSTLIRVALGTRANGAFLPLLIASEFRQSGASLDVSFRPPLSESAPPTAVERSLVEQFTT